MNASPAPTRRRLRVVIVHGTYGHPGENWFPWLGARLRARGHTVAIPALPTPAGQSLRTWLLEFDRQVDELDARTVLVGHSLGAAFSLRLLERQLEQPVRHVYLVGGFVGSLDMPEFDRLNESFFVAPMNWEKIKSSASGFTAYHGDDDPYVPESRGRAVATALGARFVSIRGGGHLNTASGFVSFEALASDIEMLACASS